MPTTLVSWNNAKGHEPWRQLLQMGADIALLQEAGPVPPDVADEVDTGPVEHWDSHVWNSHWYEGRFKDLYDRWPMVVKLSDRVEVEWFKQVSPISEPAEDEIAVSGIGTISAARVIPKYVRPFIAVSMYARWTSPHLSTNRTGWIYSDLSAFIGSTDPGTHRILAAGDLNTRNDERTLGRDSLRYREHCRSLPNRPCRTPRETRPGAPSGAALGHRDDAATPGFPKLINGRGALARMIRTPSEEQAEEKV